MMIYRGNRFLVLVVFFFLNQDEIQAKENFKFDFNFSLEAYLQPTYFWPLDYTTWVREVIENKNPSIQGGSSGLGITGKGKGYLKFPLLTSSANLGSYQHKCLTKPQQCDTGLTLGFWVKLSSIKASVYRQEFSFLRTISESVEKAATLEFVFAVQNDFSAAELSVIVRASNIYKSSIKIGVDKWHHIMITINDRGLKTYLNTQLIPTSKVYNREYKAYDSVTFQLGQYPKLPPSVQSFERATTSVDNLVIWDRVLTNQEIEKIYFVEFGTIKPSCIANSNSHEIFWNKLNDIYNHVTGYSVAWWENGKPHSTMTIPYTMGQKDKNLKAIIEAFQSNRNYDYQISAETLGKKMIKQDVKCSKIAENKKFRLFSDTPRTIFIEWISPKGKYLYEIFLAKTRVGQLSKNPLKYQLTDLKKNRAYDVTVRRVNLESGQITSYRENVTTLTIAETMSTSVKSAQIKRNTWNETEIGVILHPELQGKNMSYILINREPSKSESTGKKIPWDNSKNTWLDFTVRNLKPNTEYIFDVVLRDRDSDKLGPRMLKPLMWKTKVKFPTSITVNVLSVESKSVTLSMVTPKDIQVVSASTHIKIIVKSASKTHIRIIPISKAKNFTIGGLEHYTEYEITTALGDGVDFGNETKPIAFKTKVSYDSPTHINVITVTHDNLTFSLNISLTDKNLVSHVKLSTRTTRHLFVRIMAYRPIFTISNLRQLTMYKLMIALGNGTSFGPFGPSESVVTKVSYDPPSHVSVLNISHDSATMMMKLNKFLIDKKKLTHIKLRITSQDKTVEKVFRVDEENESVVLSKLKQATHYQVQIATGDGVKFGRLGGRIEFKTKVNFSAPKSIKILSTTTLSALFEIIPPRQLVYGNHVTRILFQVMTDSSYYGIMMKYNKTNIYELKKLSPLTKYTVRTILGSDKTIGKEASDSITFTTKPNIGTPDIQLLAVGPTHVSVNIARPQGRNSRKLVSSKVITKVVIRIKSNEGKEWRSDTVTLDKIGYYTVKNLSMASVYRVSTAYANESVVYAFGNEVKCTTSVRYDPPTAIHIVEATSTTFRLQVKLSSQQQDLVNKNSLTHIKISLKSPRHSLEVIRAIETSDNVLINNLTYYTAYDVRAACGDGSVFGNFGEAVMLKTKIQFNPPTNLTVYELSYNSLTLRLNLPTDARQNLLVTERQLTHVAVYIETSASEIVRVDIYNFTKEVLIDKLTKFTEYWIRAAFGDGHAFGSKSQILHVVTKAHFESSIKISVSSVTFHTAWVAVQLEKHDLVQATQMKFRLSTGGKITSEFSIPVFQEVKTTLQNLIANTKYSLVVAAGNGDMFSNFSQPALFKTKDDQDCRLYKTCGQNMTCDDVKNARYRCRCNHGYNSVDEKVGCKDIDECQNVSNACGLNSKCTNTLGSFICQCLPGYQPNEDNVKGCKDINECVTKRNLCKKNERCQNTPGSFQCQCKNGFKRINGFCLSEEEENQICKFEIYNNITWMTAQAGQMVNQSCPKDYEGFIYRACAMKNKMAKWRKPDSGQCVNKALSALVLKKGSQQVDVIAKSLNTFVKQQDNKMTTGDVNVIVDMMSELVKDDRNEGSTQETFVENIINVASELLQPKTRNAWTEFPKEKRTVKAAGLLNTADKIIEVSASALKKDSTKKKVIKTENIVMEIQRVKPPTDNEKSVKFNNNLELPPDALNINSTLVFVKYNGIEEILGVPRNTTLRKNTNITESYLNSQVTSITVFPTMKKTFEKPVVFSLQHGGLRNNTIPNCVYWHEVHSGGHWSDKGCFVDKYNESHVTCHCYHLTNFAILMSVTDTGKDISVSAKRLMDTDELALSLITIIGLTISLGALAIAFISFIFIKTIRSLRNTVHKHLCVALFIAEAIFLFGIDKTANKIGCQVIAASLHYFFLVAFFIMGLEGIVLYLMLVRVYRSMGTSGYGSPKFIALCWVLPIVIITVNLFIDQNAYGNIHGACWLSITNGFIWSFVGPVLIVILMNFVFLALTIKVMSDKAKRRSSTVDEIWFWTKGVCLLLSILGVTWVVGVLYVSSDTVFFAYLFSIVNSLQGLSIFVFHCACDPRVRKAYRDFFFCVSVRQKHELIRSMSRTRSTSGSKSSLKKSPHSTQAARYISKNKETVPLYSNGSTSTPENSFGLLVGTNKF